jgi:tetratricopeptide (TPR) repeat protein
VEGLTITEILRVAPNVKILVTSREHLHLYEEQVYPIEGLTCSHLTTLDEIDRNTAPQLFLQSSKRFIPDFELSIDDLHHLESICRLVAGMPLALELAASWVSFFSLKEIADEIQKSLDFLGTDWQDVEERHRSMRATLEISWSRLNPAEQVAFRRLSAFKGSFSREAALSVSMATVQTLARLVSKSLLQYDRQLNRYSLHQLIRQYSLGELKTSPLDHEMTLDRHSAFYCTLLQKFESEIQGEWEFTNLPGLESIIENIRSAWIWAVNHHKVDRIDQTAFALDEFADWYYPSQDAINLCQLAIETFLSLPHESDSVKVSRVILRLKIVQAWICFYIGNLENVYLLLSQCGEMIDSDVLTSVDTRIEKAFYLALKGVIYVFDPVKRLSFFRQALDYFRSLNMPFHVATTLRGLGTAHLHNAELHQAEELYKESLKLNEELGNQPGVLLVLNHLGILARESGDFDKAIYYFNLIQSQAQGNFWGKTMGSFPYTHLMLFMGRLDEAEKLVHQTQYYCRESGSRFCLARSLGTGGMTTVHYLSGRFEKAIETITQAMAIWKESDNQLWVTACTVDLAHIYIYTMDLVSARTCFNLVIRKTYPANFVYLECLVYRAMGWIHIAENNYVEAREWLEKAESRYRKMKDQDGKENLAWILALIIRTEIGLNNLSEAIQLSIEALGIAVNIGAFLPLLFLMPVVSLLLTQLKQYERAVELLTLAESSPFVMKSKLMQDVMCDPTRLACKHLPSEAVEAAQIRGQSLDWWETTASLLDELRALETQ